MKVIVSPLKYRFAKGDKCNLRNIFFQFETQDIQIGQTEKINEKD